MMAVPLAFTQIASLPRAFARGMWIAWIAFAVTLASTTASWRYVVNSEERNADLQFQTEAREVREMIAARMVAYAQVLRGGSALFAASASVDRHQWKRYVETLRIEENYPGIQALSFNQVVASREREAHIRAVRAEGLPDYDIRPQGERPGYAPVVYIEPFRDVNLRAQGYDVASEPVRRASLERSRDSGDVALTGRVKLVQESWEKEQAGTLMMLAIYRNGAPVATVPERRAAVLGYVTAVFRMNDLMTGALVGRAPLLDLEIYDGTEPSAATLMYDDGRHAAQAPRFVRDMVRDIGGRNWTVRLASTPEFEARVASALPLVTLLGGIALSLTVFALVVALVLVRRRVLELAAQATDLRQSRERLDYLLGAAPVIIYSARPGGDYGVTFMSANVRDVLGYAPEDFLRDAGFWPGNIHPDDRERVFAQLAELDKTDTHAFECRYRHQNGSWLWMRDEFKMIRDASGAPQELVGYWVDISARKAAQETLRESDARHQAVIESALDAIVVNDGEGRVTAFNGAAERMFGYRREQVIGRDLADLFIPAVDGEILRRRFRESLASETPVFEGRRVEASALHADGHTLPIELAVQRIDRGCQMFFTAFMRDLTEVKRAEQTQARFASILDATPDFVGYADAKDTHVIHINPAGRKLIGIGQDEDVTRLKIADVHPEWTSKLFREEILPAAMRDGVWAGESAFLNRDGREIPVMMVFLAHRASTGEVDMYSTISRDITERRRVEAAMAEALRAKSEFMANVTHELRTPLNAVIGFAELLNGEVPGPLNAKQAEFAADILASGQRLLALVEGILEMSRLDVAGAALEREPVEIGAALQERVAAARKAAEAQRVSVSLEVAADVGSAELDPKALRRILDALLDNAIKFNCEGGTVAVSARRAGGALEIAVADTGIGIAQEDLAKLFKPLVQINSGLARHHGGIGLGLALARRLAELHGGTIEVESVPGEGSSFTLCLPIQEKMQ